MDTPINHPHSSSLDTYNHARNQRTDSADHSSDAHSDFDEDEPHQQISFDSFAAFGIDIDLDASLDLDLSPYANATSLEVSSQSASPNHVRFDLDEDDSEDDSEYGGLAYDRASEEEEDMDDDATPTTASLVTSPRRLTPIHTILPPSPVHKPLLLSPSDGLPSAYFPPSPTASAYSQSPASETDGESETSSAPPLTPDVTPDWFNTAIASVHLETDLPSVHDVDSAGERNVGYDTYGEVPRVVVFSADPSDGDYKTSAKSRTLAPPRILLPPPSLSLHSSPRLSPRSLSSPLSPRALHSPLSPSFPSSPISPTFNPLPKPGHRPLRLLQRADLFAPPQPPSPYGSQMFFLPTGWRERRAPQTTKPRPVIQSSEVGRRRTAVDEALLRGLRPLILVDERVVEEIGLEKPVYQKRGPERGSKCNEEVKEEGQESTQEVEWRQWSTEGLSGRPGKPKLREEVRMRWEIDARRWISVHVADSYERMARRTMFA